MSVGGKGFRTGVNSRGQGYSTVSLPGTGLSYTSYGRTSGTRGAAVTHNSSLPKPPGKFTNWLLSKSSDPKKRGQAKLNQAQVVFSRGDYKGAIPVLREAEQLYPSASRLHFLLGSSLNNLGEYKQAVPYMERYIRVVPQDFPVVSALAAAYYNLEEYDRAIETLQAVPEGIQADNLVMLKILALSFARKGQYSVAVEVLKRAPLRKRNLTPELVEILYLLGEGYEKLGDMAHAKRCFERVYAVDAGFKEVAEKVAKYAH